MGLDHQKRNMNTPNKAVAANINKLNRLYDLKETLSVLDNAKDGTLTTGLKNAIYNKTGIFFNEGTSTNQVRSLLFEQAANLWMDVERVTGQNTTKRLEELRKENFKDTQTAYNSLGLLENRIKNELGTDIETLKALGGSLTDGQINLVNGVNERAAFNRELDFLSKDKKPQAILNRYAQDRGYTHNYKRLYNAIGEK